MPNVPTRQEMKSNFAAEETQRPLRELSLLYLRLGTTAFGGPAAHIAMMEDEVVRRRGWLTREEFLDLLGVVRRSGTGSRLILTMGRFPGNRTFHEGRLCRTLFNPDVDSCKVRP